MTIKTLAEVVEQIKLEVIEDVKNRIVPIDVATFSELHDFVDANCYGGFCDDNGIVDELIALHGGRDPSHEGMPSEVFNFINGAQNSINDWINEGGVVNHVELALQIQILKEAAPIIRKEKENQREKENLISAARRRKSSLVEKLQTKIDSGEITDGRQADRAVTEILNDSGLELHSEEYENLSDALCDVAGKEFPGEWDVRQRN